MKVKITAKGLAEDEMWHDDHVGESFNVTDELDEDGDYILTAEETEALLVNEDEPEVVGYAVAKSCCEVLTP